MFVTGSIILYMDADAQTGLNGNHHHILIGGSSSGHGMAYVFPGLNSGNHDVWITWPEGWNDRTTTLSVEVFDDTTSVIDTTIDESVSPSGVTDLGVGWKYIGRANISSGTLKVQITAKATTNSRVVADAVRVQEVSGGTLHYGDDGAWPSTGSAFQSRRLGSPVIGVKGVRIY